jgi:phosphoserine phosphatase RsbU/P
MDQALNTVAMSTVASAPSIEASTILVADDDPDVLDFVAHCLRRAGYAVLTAESGTAVMTLLDAHEPALFLLDGQMPGMTGFELCRHLGRNPRFRDRPVIFLTGLSQPEHIVHAFEAGGVDYVRKPLVLPELLARIHTHLDLAASRRAERRRADRFESITLEQGQRLEEVRTGQELLLKDPREFPDLKMAVRFQPASVAGGDFYEITRLSADEVALFVADVSGHDLSMPFVTGALKALTASFLNEVLSPDETLIQLNASLRRFLTEGRYVSACYARYSTLNGTVDVVNAGHPCPLFQPLGQSPAPVPLVGDVLGIFETVRCGMTRLDVKRGDRFFLFTDGLTEGLADGQSGMLHGQTLLQKAVSLGQGSSINAVVHGTVDDLLARRTASMADDIVFLGIEF